MKIFKIHLKACTIYTAPNRDCSIFNLLSDCGFDVDDLFRVATPIHGKQYLIFTQNNDNFYLNRAYGKREKVESDKVIKFLLMVDVVE